MSDSETTPSVSTDTGSGRSSPTFEEVVETFCRQQVEFRAGLARTPGGRGDETAEGPKVVPWAHRRPS